MSARQRSSTNDAPAEKRAEPTLSSTRSFDNKTLSVDPASVAFRRVALVSHDYNVPDARGLFDYSEHFGRINKVCDDLACDTVLYALYTWDSRSPILRTHDSVFSGLQHVQRIVLEIGLPPDSADSLEVWIRGRLQPIRMLQRFATSQSPTSDKQRFMDDLGARQIGPALLMICGETNIASTVRGSNEFYDPFGFTNQLRNRNVELVLNPIHDYMRRHEMREKRRFYSQQARTVLSVWNKGKGSEASLPWTVFHNGHEKTDRVSEQSDPIPERPDIRIGTIDLAALLRANS